MSAGVPWNPADPWWIITLAFGSAKRFPGAPPHRRIAPSDMAMPTQIVETWGLMNCMVS